MSNHGGYQNLQDEAEEYVPTEQIQEPTQQVPQQQQPISATQKQPEPQVAVQQQNVQTTATNPQAFYAVPIMGQNGQQQIVYIPQNQYAQFLQQQQMYQQYLLQQQQLQQQQQSGQPQIQLPPLPNVNQIPQQQPAYVQPTIPNMQPTTPIVTNTTVQVTDDSYVKVQGVEPLLVLLCNLFFPGLGHLVIGQQSKGVVYIAFSVVAATIVGILCAFFIGIPLIPLMMVYNVLVLIDGYVIADRIRKGYPVLKGECYFRITSWGVGLVENKSPVFVHGSADEPAIWQLQCRQVDRQRNL